MKAMEKLVSGGKAIFMSACVGALAVFLYLFLKIAVCGSTMLVEPNPFILGAEIIVFSALIGWGVILVRGELDHARS